jgi:predicted dehydrogenase/threonine dehydrogenase-like Zn-dependent dehydrogenase
VKQIIQNLKNGATTLADVPCPQIKSGWLLINSTISLVSAGTERMLMEFGKASYISKARQQPDKVKQVLEKVSTDGLLATYDAVSSKLDQPIPLGYCNVGVIEKIGKGIDGFSVGDRVVSNGPHAEIVRVPKNLCAKIPDTVDDESASFTVIGAIALQGIRLLNPTLGETIVVMGLGLVGLMAVQLLKSNGCRVLGIDFEKEKCSLAESFGAETINLSQGDDPVRRAMEFSRGRGVDGVLVAAATSSDDPMHNAALMCRKRGRIVLVGVTGLKLSRDDFFKKELTFQVSASYGPGRYDPLYEEVGHDYPVGFVRWTEQRNFEAVLDMMADGKLNVAPLVSHRFDLSEAEKAYAVLGGPEKNLGILIQYPSHGKKEENNKLLRSIPLINKGEPLPPSQGNVAFIGAGNYASRVLIPAFFKAGARLDTIVTSGGINGVHHGKKYGFRTASTDVERVLKNDAIDTVVIATQHNTHAEFIKTFLKAGKHVFVEKPLALTLEEINEIDETIRDIAKNQTPLPKLMVGFNRRFSPHIIKTKALLDGVKEPKSFIITVNAGNIPDDHWTQDILTGGGRIIGEGCHFIDLMRFLAGSEISDYQFTTIGRTAGMKIIDDKVSITLSFKDGSFGTIHYLANGGKSFPKERVEVFCNDAVLQLDNFRSLRGFGWKGFKKMGGLHQDKGQKNCVRAFMDSITSNKAAPIPFPELIEVARITVEIAHKARG